MAYNTGVTRSNSRGEIFSHFTGVRLRLNGSGVFRMQYSGLDDTGTVELLPLTMATSPGKEPFRLANFVGQRASFKGYTTDKDETFNINRIVLFAANLWAETPNLE